MTLKEYIQGKRNGKEANRLERQAMSDPFLDDAIEGFDAVGGDHIPVIERLEAEVLPAGNHRRRGMAYWAAAASILLLIGFGSFFFLQQKPATRMPPIATVLPEKMAPEMEHADTTITKPTTLPKQKINKKMLAVVAAPETIGQDEASDVPVSVPMMAAAKMAKAAGDSGTVINSMKTDKILKKRMLSVQSATTRATSNMVQGRVVDKEGEPLTGVSINEKGTNRGAVTDANGNFRFQISGNDSAKLVANHVGFEQKEVKPSSEPLTIALNPSDMVLHEVVVVGYGARKNKDVTAAVAQISPEGFGEKEFTVYCTTYAVSNLCGESKSRVKVSFVISKEGRPTDIKVMKFTCRQAADEIERLLNASPVWTKKDRKVTMTIKW